MGVVNDEDPAAIGSVGQSSQGDAEQPDMGGGMNGRYEWNGEEEVSQADQSNGLNKRKKDNEGHGQRRCLWAMYEDEYGKERRSSVNAGYSGLLHSFMPTQKLTGR